MRRQNRRKQIDEDIETKKILTVSISVLIIAILAFMITFIIYSNYLDNNADMELAKLESESISQSNQEDSSQASSSIGKTVNEVKEENTTQTKEEKTTKVAVNTSNMVKENTNKVQNSTAETKEEKVPDPTFIKPVEGEIMVQFAKDNLIYSKTLQEWVTHTGIDIKADKASVVKASADGEIKSIKNDPRYGITIVMEHANGFSTIYSNLLTSEFVKEGEKINQGQTIGTVGNTAIFEIADDTHLHFEILKNNEILDPTQYIN